MTPPSFASSSNVWSEAPMARRLAWVRAFRRAVAREERDLCARALAETGKPRDETLTADLLPLVSACLWLERHAPRTLRPRSVPGRPLWMLGMRHRVERAPLGRVGVIATWNYPYSLLGQQIAEALVAGNRVVVKPSERCPDSQGLLLALARDPGGGRALPEGVLEVIGHDREAGAALAGDPSIDHLVFTGSTEVGRTIAQTLAPRLTTSSLELSGRDSALVLADADPRLAARTLWGAVTLNRGQTCMAPRRALVDRAVYPAFVEAMSRWARGAGPMRLIDADAAARVRALVEEAVSLGGRDLAAPAQDAREERDPAEVFPAAVADCPPDAPLVQGRHFGPAIAIVPVDGPGEALRLHRACDQHLAASVFTRRPARHRALAARLGATCVTINDCIVPSAHPGAPIGGLGPSGWGLTQGREGLLAMTRPVVVSRTSPRVRLPAGPVDEKRTEQLASFLRWRYGR